MIHNRIIGCLVSGVCSMADNELKCSDCGAELTHQINFWLVGDNDILCNKCWIDRDDKHE